MKGIAHFVGGIAVASAFPSAVKAAEMGSGIYLLAGGVFGLLPDTLDFKIGRYFCGFDIEVAPDSIGTLRPGLIRVTGVMHNNYAGMRLQS